MTSRDVLILTLLACVGGQTRRMAIIQEPSPPRDRSRYTSSHLPLSPGTRLGVYEITGQIGEGRMGEVYRATDTRLKRHVAIKVLPESLTGDHATEDLVSTGVR